MYKHSYSTVLLNEMLLNVKFRSKNSLKYLSFFSAEHFEKSNVTLENFVFLKYIIAVFSESSAVYLEKSDAFMSTVAPFYCIAGI